MTDLSSFLAATRRVLHAVGLWTNWIYDGGAASRLLETDVSPDGGPDRVSVFAEPRSAGARIEDSTAFRSLARAYDFASSGEWSGTLADLQTQALTLNSLHHALQTDAFIGPYEEPMIDPNDRDTLVGVIEAALGRARLEQGRPVSLPTLACIADLKEKTVRMAAVGQSRSPELRTFREGSRVLVEPAEALRWLSERRTFSPTHILGNAAEVDLTPRNTVQLGTMLKTLRERVELTIEEVCEKLGFDSSEVAMLAVLEGGWWEASDLQLERFDVATLSKLARILNVQRPLEFVRSVSSIFLPYQVEGRLGGPQRGEPS